MTTASSSTASAPAAPADKTSRSRAWDRHLLVLVLLSLVVMVPRAVHIAQRHTDTFDEFYHLHRGLLYWQRDLDTAKLNDPPLGAALTALPVWLAGCRAEPVDLALAVTQDKTERARHNAQQEINSLYNNALSPETIRTIIAAWRAVLYTVLVGVVFVWCRQLYSLAAGYVAGLILLIEPNFTAHAHLITLDVPAVTGIVLACFASWSYARSPSGPRAVAAAFFIALAILIKHTAGFIPLVLLGYVALEWFVRPLIQRTKLHWGPTLRRAGRHLLIGTATLLVSLWALTLFDVSPPLLPTHNVPPIQGGGLGAVLKRNAIDIASRPLPAGYYIRTFVQGMRHNTAGRRGFLNGELYQGGKLGYFPTVLSYKAPLGLGALVGVGAASVLWRRPRLEELSLALPLVVAAGMLMTSNINIGVRHILPAYVFVLMLCVRPLASTLVWPKWVYGLGLLAAAGHVASYHPDYLSYINRPVDKPWTKISDSNIDWGQALIQVRDWVDARRQAGETRPIRFSYFGPRIDDTQRPPQVERYLGDRVEHVGIADAIGPAPTDGLFLISAVQVSGMGVVDAERFRHLLYETPDAVIGHGILVFDLDRLANKK